MIAPFTRHDGLAVYRIGDGEPLLLFPYPHGSTLRPMAEDRLAALLAGRHDPQTPLACSQELVAGIPNAALRIFEHSGHAPFVEEPALVREALAGF